MCLVELVSMLGLSYLIWYPFLMTWCMGQVEPSFFFGDFVYNHLYGFEADARRHIKPFDVQISANAETN